MSALLLFAFIYALKSTMSYQLTQAPRFVRIAAGGEHSLLMSEAGTVFSCGRVENGRLGIVRTPAADIAEPTEIPLGGTPTQIVAGEYHSAIVIEAETSKLLTFGCGAVGQLGHGSATDDVPEPREVEYFAKLLTSPLAILHVSCGDGHSLVTLSDNSVHAFGNNESGALGHASSASYSGFSKQSERYGFGVRGPSRSLAAPVVALGQQQVVKTATGTRHSLFLTASGEVYAAGDNTSFQLGLGAGLPRSTIPRKVPLDVAVRDVACGAQHSVLLCTDGSVRVCGSNKSGELGLGASVPSSATYLTLLGADGAVLWGVEAVAAGAAHTLLIINGDVYGCGWGECGALGTGSADNVLVPKQLLSSVVVSPAVALSCSSHHSMVLCSDGSVYVSGCNGHGQLGLSNFQAKVFQWHKIEVVAQLEDSVRCAAVEASVQRSRSSRGITQSEREYTPRCQGLVVPDESSTDSTSFVCFE